jgi:hypothetical protein
MGTLSVRPRFGLKHTRICVAAAALCVAATFPAAGGQERAAVPSKAPVAGDWATDIIEYIRRIIELLEGNAEGTSSNPIVAMGQVMGSYEQHGCPEGLSPAERAAARANVQAADALAAQSPPTADLATVRRFRETLKSLDADLAAAARGR